MNVCDYNAVWNAGRRTLKVGSAIRGTAQAPGAIAYPSERAAAGGRPRSLMKLLGGTASGGPISPLRLIPKKSAQSTGPGSRSRRLQGSSTGHARLSQ